jgi:adenylate cyclase class 2
MNFLNIEIKARIEDAFAIRNFLNENNAEFKGVDHQQDTYFNVKRGRLKLREGTIENNLIYYERADLEGPKNSNFQLVKVTDSKQLKDVLEKSIGIKVIVQKKREIYFIRNIKFHIDEVPGLGSFIEIEASNMNADISKEKLLEQCKFYMNMFKIKPEDLVTNSYSDLLLKEC